MTSSERARDGREPPRQCITGAALRYPDLGVVALPLPAGHAQVRALVAKSYPKRRNRHPGQEGFVTDTGEFLTSRRALLVAQRAGQTKGPSDRDELRGEDLRAPAPDRRAASDGTSRGFALADRATLRREGVRARLAGALAGAVVAAVALLIVRETRGVMPPVTLWGYAVACVATGLAAGWIAAAGSQVERLRAMIGCALVMAACTAAMAVRPAPPVDLLLDGLYVVAAGTALVVAGRLRWVSALLLVVPLIYLVARSRFLFLGG